MEGERLRQIGAIHPQLGTPAARTRTCGVYPTTRLGSRGPRVVVRRDGIERPFEELRASTALVSSTVKDLVVGSGLRFTDRRSHHLRGVPGEWGVYALGH
jgi:hypothetical protein